jgi:hypothetical protein
MSRAIRAALLWTSATVLFFTASNVLAQSVADFKIVMPFELLAGEPATLGVLGSDGRLQADVQLNLSDGESLTTDVSGRAHFLAPVAAGILFVQIHNARMISATDVLRPEGADDLKIESAPRIASLDGLLKISGSGFAGDADKNQVALNGKRALVIAASPVEFVFVPPPGLQPGVAKLDLHRGDQSASAQIVLIRVTATPQNIPPGKKQEIMLRIFGTDEPISLELHNLRPEIVQFVKHGDVRLRSSGGSDNSVPVQARGLRAGEFSFAVQYVPGAQAPNLSAARDFLQAAFVRAPQSQANLLAKILKKLQGDKPNVAAARKEFAKLPMSNSPGEYEAWLRAAHEALFGIQR